MHRYIFEVLFLCYFAETLQYGATNPLQTTQVTWREILPKDCGHRVMRLKDNSELTSREESFANIEKEEDLDGHFTTIKTHPWQVAIIRRVDKVIECGGSIISKYHVLTAAHCFVKVASEEINATATPVLYETRLVAAGCTNYAESDLEKKIKELHIHELYSYSHRRNDIALLKIDGEFEWTKYVRPICLPAEDEKYTPDLQCRISGFGNEAAEGPDNLGILRSGIVKLSSDNHCKIGNKTQNVKITEGMFCATGYMGQGVMVDMCQSESGGPLHCKDRSESKRVLFGITSVGHRCGLNNDPGVYTKVSKYIKWIRDQVEGTVKNENQPKNRTETPARIVLLLSPPKKSKPAGLPRSCGLENGFILNATAGEVDFGIKRTPWLVSLMYWVKKRQFRCSGTIISENYVLATAHCVSDQERSGMAYYIFAGDTSLQEKEREYNITRIVVHPEYNSKAFLNDIALIELSKNFIFSDKIRPICVPHHALYGKNHQVIFAGRYRSENDSEMRLFRRVDKVMAKEDCSKSYNRFRNITATMFCSVAVANNGNEVKSREDGSLIRNEGGRHYLLGVFSWKGNGTNSNDSPEVHTKVSNYKKWIKQVLTG